MLARRAIRAVPRAQGSLVRKFVSQSFIRQQEGQVNASTSTKSSASQSSRPPREKEAKSKGAFSEKLRQTLDQGSTAASRSRGGSGNKGRGASSSGSGGGSGRNSASSRPARRRPSSNERFNVAPRTSSAPVQRPTVQSDVRPATDWKASVQDSVSWARVPYAVPALDLANLNAKHDFKSHKPLRTATKALRLTPNPRGPAVQGSPQAPTPVAAPGFSKSTFVSDTTTKSAKNGDDEEQSLAGVAQERRVQNIKEISGGDYQRWQVQGFFKDVQNASPLEQDVAYAVANNDDLQPAHKAFTVDAVQQIVAKTTR